MAFTLNKRVEKVERVVKKEEKREVKKVEKTQLQTFYDLALLAKEDSFGMRGRGGKKHNPSWYMRNGVLFSTLQWLSKNGYIGKNIRASGVKDVYINWETNPQKSYSKTIESLDLNLF